MRQRGLLVAKFALALGILAIGATATAADVYWRADPNIPGDWHDPANWDPSMPSPDDHAYIDNGGTAAVASGIATLAHATVGGSLGGAVTQTGGTLINQYILFLGKDSDATGTYQITGGSLDTGLLIVGRYGQGEVLQTGGVVTVTYCGIWAIPPCVLIGGGSGGRGGYHLAGGTLITAGHSGSSLWIDRGEFLQSGGVNITDRLGVGRGTFVQTGGTAAIKIGRMEKAGGGLVHIGPEAYCAAGTLLMSTTAITLRFDLTDDAHGRIRGGDDFSAAVLGGTLDLQTDDWRPREGQAFHVLRGFDLFPDGYDWVWTGTYSELVFGEGLGDFDAIATNITGGRRLDPNGAPLPLFAGGVVADPADPNRLAYAVTFAGLTAGDANGDHVVNAGDLALVGGNWLKGGRSWSAADFNGDGKVNIGDLALMGGNWLWSLPSPPPGGTSLPEPATLMLLALGPAILVRRRR